MGLCILHICLHMGPLTFKPKKEGTLHLTRFIIKLLDLESTENYIVHARARSLSVEPK